MSHPSRSPSSRPGQLVSALTTLILVFVLAGPAFARHDLPKVTHDGLHLVEGTGFQAFYLKPGASLAAYREFKILDCFVSFKKHWQADQVSQGNRRVSPHDMDEIKKHLSAEFHAVFVKQLKDKGKFKIVDTTGPDVLILRPAIANLVVATPANTDEIGETTFAASAGQMTLYLELYDSVTSDLIARVMDAEADQGDEMIQWQNAVTNKAAADRILRRWADHLRHMLEKASSGKH